MCIRDRPSDGSYGIEKGLIYSVPVTCSGGDYTVIDDLKPTDFIKEKMKASEAELQDEKKTVASLLS